MLQSKLQKISSYLLLTVSNEQKLLCFKTEGRLFQAMTESSELVYPNCAERENNPPMLFSITYFKTCKIERNNATHFLQSSWFNYTFFYVWMSNSGFNYFLHIYLQDCRTYLCWLQEHKKSSFSCAVVLYSAALMKTSPPCCSWAASEDLYS